MATGLVRRGLWRRTCGGAVLRTRQTSSATSPNSGAWSAAVPELPPLPWRHQHRHPRQPRPADLGSAMHFWDFACAGSVLGRPDGGSARAVYLTYTYLRVLILTRALGRPSARVRMHAAAEAHVLEFCTFGVRIIQTSRGMHSSTAPLQPICELYQNHSDNINIHYSHRTTTGIVTSP